MILYYVWLAILLFSLIFVFIGIKKRDKGRIGRILWDFMPIISALPFASVFGIVLERSFSDPNLIILVVPFLTLLSLVFEAILNGRGSLKNYLPFFMSCVVVGALMEVSGYIKSIWNYPGFGAIASVIIFGYFLFFYVVIKIAKALRILVEKW